VAPKKYPAARRPTCRPGAPTRRPETVIVGDDVRSLRLARKNSGNLSLVTSSPTQKQYFFTFPASLEIPMPGIGRIRHRIITTRRSGSFSWGEKARLRASDDFPNKIDWFGTLERPPAGSVSLTSVRGRGKSKRQEDGFKTFDGRVQHGMDLTLRCAPVVSILWGVSPPVVI
jgi:hypothetical protein